MKRIEMRGKLPRWPHEDPEFIRRLLRRDRVITRRALIESLGNGPPKGALVRVSEALRRLALAGVIVQPVNQTAGWSLRRASDQACHCEICPACTTGAVHEDLIQRLRVEDPALYRRLRARANVFATAEMPPKTVVVWAYERLRATGNRCDACGEPFGTREPHFDHDHTTGKLRGLLCRRCNLIEGIANGDTLAEKAARLVKLVRWMRKMHRQGATIPR